MIAFIDKELYKELYAISKIQLKNYVKWSNFEVKIDESLLNNIKQFVPVDGGNKRNAKAYRLTKNGRETEVFKARNIQNANLDIFNNIKI